jgi:sialate O-acetylesterase
LWPLCVSADVRLPHIFGDYMVLQRDLPIHVWGWADAGEKISVRLEDQEAETAAKADGTWEVYLPARAAGGPLELNVHGKNQLALKDVLIGEVWVCSGQSNMAWVMAHQTRNHTAEIAAANHPQLRLLTVTEKASPTELSEVAAEWRVCSSRTVSYFSAVASPAVRAAV